MPYLLRTSNRNNSGALQIPPSSKGGRVKGFANESEITCLQLYRLKLNSSETLVSVLQAHL